MASANLFTDGSDISSGSSLSKETRIIGGTEAMDGRSPYVVSLKQGSMHVCGGSLIAKDTVLTAAHCLGGFVTVAAVGSDVLGEAPEIAVKSELIYPNYDSSTDQNDFGLIFLEESTTLDITLLRLNDDSSFPEIGSTAYVMGWGDTDPDDFNVETPNELMIVGLPVMSNEDCANAETGDGSYAGTIFDNMLCTESDGEDACQGDSGGPLVIRGDDPESDIQVGIVSWGIGCGSMPGVFSRVSTAYAWIQETVCAGSTDPPGSLCGVETSNPTPNPSPRPSENPTDEPTENPTDSPTLSPSLNPTTSEPTLSPTISRSPTAFPTISHNPTDFPSASPTISIQPTSSPSQSPTTSTAPTTHPSVSPSFRPSTSPTISLSPSTSSRPSTSAVPTIKKADRGGFSSNSLLLSGTTDLLDDDEVSETSGALDRMGGNISLVSVGMLLSTSIVFIWMGIV